MVYCCLPWISSANVGSTSILLNCCFSKLLSLSSQVFTRTERSILTHTCAIYQPASQGACCNVDLNLFKCRGVHVECVPAIHDPWFLSTLELWRAWWVVIVIETKLHACILLRKGRVIICIDSIRKGKGEASHDFWHSFWICSWWKNCTK